MMRRLAVLLLVFFTCPLGLDATWSIVLANSRTKEVAVGSVTCLTSFDLRAETPVVLVGVGAATSQALLDVNGARRMRIRSLLLQGFHPDEIIRSLSSLEQHGARQYGIADTLGRMATFTGVQTLSWSGGVIGRIGDDLVYAVQGNILAGDCVVPAIETAIRTSPGDVPEKLLQGMIAARVTGGDGRCSCVTMGPEDCGCPPVAFEKSGHIGFMIVARRGDVDDPTCNVNGCADGNYFMNFNISHQSFLLPDPVFQLSEQFSLWRADHIGRPDAIQSRATIARANEGFELSIELHDWQRTPVDSASVQVAVEHEPESDGVNLLGPVIDRGDGVFTVALTPTGVGNDRYRITVEDGVRPVILMPSPALCIGDVVNGQSPDCNGNGLADECEIFDGLIGDENENGIPDPCEQFQRGDCDGNGAVLFADAIQALHHLFDGQTTVICQRACDANDDGILTLEDPFHVLRFSLQLGPPPAPPFGACGFDPTPDGLACDPFPPCL